MKAVKAFLNLTCMASVLANAGAVYAWDIQKSNGVTTVAENKGPWGVFFSGNRTEAVFCFVGPITAEVDQPQTVQLKVGTGPWFDAPLVGYDHETLCAMETKKAQGLFGAMVAHGSISFSITQRGQFQSVKFEASELKAKVAAKMVRDSQ